MLNEQKWRGQNLRSGKQVPNASFENLASRLDLEEWDGQMPNYLERAGPGTARFALTCFAPFRIFERLILQNYLYFCLPFNDIQTVF